ncbi:MAG: methyltransferase domain-containing protein [Opitutales bacterium]
MTMPRDWNQAYQNGDTPWDKGEPAPPLVEFLGRRKLVGQVLVPGCGSGHDVRLLAGQGAVVTGLDIAPAALEVARRYPAAGRERYICGDFCALAETLRGGFDLLFEHTCLCAIDPAERQAYARSAAAALRPRGYLLGIFYRRVQDTGGGGPPYPVESGELDALFAAAFETLESYVPRRTYPSRPFGCEEVRWMRRR